MVVSATFPRLVLRALVGVSVMLVVGILIWQAITAGGAPDPLAAEAKSKPTVATLDIGVLVFREGLECILVLAAVTASMVGTARSQRKPVAAGAGLGLLATLVTWFVAVGIVSDLTESFPALQVQAATGLLAVIVLLVVMNWFFHKVYWGGWIALHNRQKKNLLSGAASRTRLWWGLALLGFTSLYREGFEVVLFLQSYRLKLGDAVVLRGVMAGIFLTGIVAVLTFIAHQRLPYRRMLVLTGVMLGIVLLVMVGEEAQEMQLAHWLPTTKIKTLEDALPGWMGLWFAITPTVETLLAQLVAALVVVGSYWFASAPAARQKCEIDCGAPQGDGAATEKNESCDPLCLSATACRPKRDLTAGD